MWGTTWAITCRLIGQRAADCQRETKYTIWNKTHISGVQQMYVVFIVILHIIFCKSNTRSKNDVKQRVG